MKGFSKLVIAAAVLMVAYIVIATSFAEAPADTNCVVFDWKSGHSTQTLFSGVFDTLSGNGDSSKLAFQYYRPKKGTQTILQYGPFSGGSTDSVSALFVLYMLGPDSSVLWIDTVHSTTASSGGEFILPFGSNSVSSMYNGKFKAGTACGAELIINKIFLGDRITKQY